MKRRTKVVFGAVGLVVVGGLAVVVGSSRGSGRGNDVTTVTVTRDTIVDKALAVGRIEPEIEVSVKSQISGVVGRLLADEGDFVRSGAPLLEIKPNPTPLELADARRQLELRQIELDNLKRDLERQRALKEQGLLSDREFQLTEQQYAGQQIKLEMARERLALLEEGKLTAADDEVETVVRSPIDGFILEKMVDIGDPVVPLSTYQEGTVLMTMAEMNKLVFRGTVDEIDVGKLREGMPVEIKIGALPDARVEGRLTKISLKARTEDNSTVFPVEITLTETHSSVLRAGYSANADVFIDRRDSVIVIPERLVTFSGDTARVRVQLPDGTIEDRVIETGLSDAINVEVLSGLREGEKVVEPPPREIT
ncbi:MAG: efflux RND transporter periplasmic adaptor subunit [Gemmatimonadales bacterium]|nr:efflux RND transporter periplasmic adaptor subunit [Gemmatimonadales bacterium]NIN12030.1 efflux RND transporter periplasmic adaptor subunit [Gemmatimonadales bacterium]NIR03265.1 efflux RND transporter periplasmic adaptor subunit [Gemmatimonadales bacterium]NIS66945.1 efflux RND transporter periplasmic adaptor subunit [Gemmatimonadales bacterium]